VQGCIFLAGTFLLWYWVGSAVDRRQRPKFPASLRLVSLTIGFLFAMVVDGFASYFAMHTNADLPMREVGFVGLVWAVALLWYFVSNLTAALRPA